MLKRKCEPVSVYGKKILLVSVQTSQAKTGSYRPRNANIQEQTAVHNTAMGTAQWEFKELKRKTGWL